MKKSQSKPGRPSPGNILSHSVFFACGAAIVFIGFNRRNEPDAGPENINRSTATDRRVHAGPSDPAASERVSSGRAKPTASETAINNRATIIARLNDIRLIGDPLDRQSALMDLIERLGPDQFQAVAEEFSKLEHYGNGRGEFDLIMRGWAKADPVSALEYAKNHPNGGENTALVLSSWAGRDPDAAERWALANHSGKGANAYLAAVISGIAHSDIERATKLAATMPASRERERAADAIARALMVQGVDVAMAFPDKVQDPQLRSGLVSILSERLARRDVDKAAAWIAEMNDPEAQRRSAREIAGRLARGDVENAASWVSRLDPKAQAEAALGAIVPMSNVDITGTAQWVSKLSGIPNYDNVVEEFVWSCDQRAPEQSAAWIRGIADQERQTRLYHRMLGDWFRRDANAARQWVSSNQVPPSVTQRFGK